MKLFNLVSRLHCAMFARPAFRRLNMGLCYLGLNGLGVLNYQNNEVSGEKYLLSRWLPRMLAGTQPVIFDVGANVGDYSQMLVQHLPKAFVHAFEPHPQNYAKFLQHRFPAERVKCHNIAVGAAKGSLTLYDHAGSAGSTHASVYEATITELYDDEAIATSVPVETLDEVADREGVSHIDFLKIDTEGHELAVLAGAKRLLGERRIRFIQFEFNALHVFSRVFFRDFRQVLADYELYRLLPQGLLPLDSNVTFSEIFAYQNILAIPK